MYITETTEKVKELFNELNELAFLLYNTFVYNKLIGKKEAYEDNGVIVGIGYNECDNELISKFEKLEFDEKLDIFSEIIIRYDNETYFDKRITMISFDTELSEFDIANIIKDLTNNHKNLTNNQKNIDKLMFV